MFDVIILLGGKGERCNLPLNKVFNKVNNEALFKYSLNVFLKLEANEIILVSRKEDEALLKKELEDYDFPIREKIKIVCGGKTRQDSVYEGVKETRSEYVVIHDGARPNICSSDVLKAIEIAKKTGSSLLARKETETIKKVNEDKVTTLDRASLWIAETPQVLKRILLIEALEKARKEGFYGTDDTVLLEKYFNVSPSLVPSTTYNLKITTKEDFNIFEGLLKKTH